MLLDIYCVLVVKFYLCSKPSCKNFWSRSRPFKVGVGGGKDIKYAVRGF